MLKKKVAVKIKEDQTMGTSGVLTVIKGNHIALETFNTYYFIKNTQPKGGRDRMTERQRTIKYYFSPYLTQEIFKHVTTCLFWGERGRSHTYFRTFPECTFVIKSNLSKH